MRKIKLVDQDILVGSLKIISEKIPFDKHKFMVEHMSENQAYKNFLKLNNAEIKENILELFKKKYLEYRENWTNNAKRYYSEEIKNYNILPPQCIDIETAAICDLACPHCFREYLITPDKVMTKNLYNKIINEVKEMKVPSIKLNWRGEPLLNPNLIEMIKLAKLNGVIDVSINTNAVTLNKKKSLEIIDSGLDNIIFSFDGGSEKTYEKYRPGRFKKNSFKAVYENIKNFCILKKEKKKLFPITKIQMVITNETKSEINDFFNLFEGYVDDITVTPYQERGGGLDDVDNKVKQKLKNYFIKNNLSLETPYLSQGDDKLFVSESRESCFQPLQRLMVTYNGMVAMCCLDWSAQHCVGYVDELAYQNDIENNKVNEKIQKGQRGFELLKNAKYSPKYNVPQKKISTLKEIWYGKEIDAVREVHKKKLLDKLDVCKKCSFMDTYKWKKI